MKPQLTTYFTFSKKEFNGILILFLLIVLILVFPFCYNLLDRPEKYDSSQFKKEIAIFKASAKERKVGYHKLREAVEEIEHKPEYFEFDPNSATVSQWNKLGLSPRQIKVIMNYRSKGGKFFRNEDLRKIYSITEKQYAGLERYINIKPNPSYSFNKRQLPGKDDKNVQYRRAIVVVELNSADSAMLEQLRGIGPAFAMRIVKFRNRLGGFFDKSQLREVYGMDSLRYAQLEKEITVDPLSIKRLNVNTATFEEMRNHPYLTFKQINAIIQYRKQHGNYNSPDDLKKVLILNEEIIRKITPYLSF